ncbi:phosphate/phosphite/phosphonate ABC transporter substrate-binding protein [Thiomicrospira pelophila]|uniref:phosphate/phosphite/phosphonate ABC transporter substrate-binding protein n=1 Tax=Thiomicrospira pelophila TaxID=934 RepID=UPI0006906C78|nr:phosphate/phosphite/phosphonate ABC transporter substrate-binding protein [Thiomicrospira pelophila]
MMLGQTIHKSSFMMRASLIIALALILVGCKDETHQTAKKPKSQPPGLVLAVPPYEMPSNIQQRFHPLVTHLTEQLNQPVQLYITTSYEDQVKRLANGEVDLAYMGPSSYVKTRDNFPESHPILIAAEAPYRAALIVHKHSDINHIKQLNGRSFAFGSYHSYSGHYVVRQLLRLNHIYLRDLQFYSFLGRHERAIMSVVHQDFDAAATTEGLAQRFIELGYPIRVVATSELLAPTVIVARKNLKPELIQSLRESLLFFQSDIKHTGLSFFEVDNQDFTEVEKILYAIEH